MPTSYDALPLFLTVAEFASVMNIGLSTAYAFVRSGQVKTVRIGTQYRIPKSALESMIAPKTH